MVLRILQALVLALATLKELESFANTVAPTETSRNTAVAGGPSFRVAAWGGTGQRVWLEGPRGGTRAGRPQGFLHNTSRYCVHLPGHPAEKSSSIRCRWAMSSLTVSLLARSTHIVAYSFFVPLFIRQLSHQVILTCNFYAIDAVSTRIIEIILLFLSFRKLVLGHFLLGNIKN